MLKLQNYDVHMLYNFFTFHSTQITQVMGPMVCAQAQQTEDMVMFVYFSLMCNFGLVT